MWIPDSGAHVSSNRGQAGGGKVRTSNIELRTLNVEGRSVSYGLVPGEGVFASQFMGSLP